MLVMQSMASPPKGHKLFLKIYDLLRAFGFSFWAKPKESKARKGMQESLYFFFALKRVYNCYIKPIRKSPWFFEKRTVSV